MKTNIAALALAVTVALTGCAATDTPVPATALQNQRITTESRTGTSANGDVEVTLTPFMHGDAPMVKAVVRDSVTGRTVSLDPDMVVKSLADYTPTRDTVTLIVNPQVRERAAEVDARDLAEALAVAVGDRGGLAGLPNVQDIASSGQGSLAYLEGGVVKVDTQTMDESTTAPASESVVLALLGYDGHRTVEQVKADAERLVEAGHGDDVGQTGSMTGWIDWVDTMMDSQN